MALRLAEIEPREYQYIFTPTGNEMPEMVEHWKRLGELLGTPLRPITTKSLVHEALRQKCLPNHRMRWCTRILKIEPYQKYLVANSPCVSYVGLRADEIEKRDGVDHSSIDGVENRYPMVEWGWGIGDVLRYLDDKGIEVPERTDCAMCFFQRLSEWWRLWHNHPDLYQEAEELELSIGNTLRSDGRDTWPAALRELRAEFEMGRVPKGANQPSLFGTATRKTMCSFCAR